MFVECSSSIRIYTSIHGCMDGNVVKGEARNLKNTFNKCQSYCDTS